MKILVICPFLPMADRQAGDLRFMQILKILASRHDVMIYATQLAEQKDCYGANVVEQYQNVLAGLKIYVSDIPGSVNLLLRTQHYHMILFKHYETLQIGYVTMRDLRFWQPDAHVIIDTVDVEFHRLESKAKVTNRVEDAGLASERKSNELRAYNDADLVIVVSEADREILKAAGVHTGIEIVSLVHDIPQLKPVSECAVDHSLMFIANFELDANMDAIAYFTREVFPLVRDRIPQARLRIAGNGTNDEVRALASENIEVLGFVPDLNAVYAQNRVAVVPLRWGGGLKGKIVEAMSYGVPVVSTTTGIEGFGFTPGEHVLIGDSPESFADGVCRLLEDAVLYQEIRTNGWCFVRDRFSEHAAAGALARMFDQLRMQGPKSIGLLQRTKKNIWLGVERNLLWRVKQWLPSA